MYKNEEEGESSIPKEELLRPMSQFPWVAAARRGSVTSSGNETQSFSKHMYQLKGCASAELGAHALIKFSNRNGFEFGSSVVCLSHLIHTDPHAIHSSILTDVSFGVI